MRFELGEQVIISGSQYPDEDYHSDFFGKIISLTDDYNIQYCNPIYDFKLKIDQKYIKKIYSIDTRVLLCNSCFKLNKGAKIIQDGIEYILQDDAVLQTKDTLIIDKV